MFFKKNKKKQEKAPTYLGYETDEGIVWVDSSKVPEEGFVPATDEQIEQIIKEMLAELQGQ